MNTIIDYPSYTCGQSLVSHFIFFSYKLRIECMLLKEEWVSTAGYLESAINAILVAGDDLMSSRALQVILTL